MIGAIVKHYQIISELGAGGMGVVFKARDQRLGRFVALKFLPERLHNDREALDRFLREAQTASSLNHPGICTIFDFDECDGKQFMVMEFLEGITLRERLNQGPVPPEEMLPWLTQALDALGAAHKQGIIHRDLKPENIFMTRDKRVKLLDFGLAKPVTDRDAESDRTMLTVPGMLLGTVPYMSPEQVRGELADLRTDLYSIGMVYYEAITGLLPTRCRTVALSLVSILQDAPPKPSQARPDLSARWDSFCMRAIDKDPAARFQSASAMLREFRRLVEVRPEASPEGPNLGTPWPPDSPPREFLPAEGPLRLIGREEECRQIEWLCHQAEVGRGSVLLIEGQSGIGKTRLLEFALDHAREIGWAVLMGRCSEFEGSYPFFPFVEMLEDTAQSCKPEDLRTLLGDAAPELSKLAPRLRRIFPDLPASMELPPEQERFLLFNSLLEFFRQIAGAKPMLLALEDLHWADEPTTTFLQHLTKHLRGKPVMVLCTIQEGAFDPQGALAATYRELLKGKLVSRLRLRSLDAQSVAKILTEIAGSPPPATIVKEFMEVTDGNPFFVEELHLLIKEEGLLGEGGTWPDQLDLKDLRVPEGIRILLNRRLARLDDEAVRVLQLAAVIGRSFSLSLLTSCSGQPEGSLIEALEEAEKQHQVDTSVVDGEVIYTFSNAMIRRTLLDSISAARLRLHHVRIANALDELGHRQGQTRASELVHHLTQAGSAIPVERLQSALLQAIQEALGTTAFEKAVGYADSTLQAGRLAAEMRAQVLYLKGLAQTGLGNWTGAQSTWMEALEILERTSASELGGKICAILAGQFIWSGRLENCFKIARRGLSLIDERPSPERCRLLAWAGHSMNQSGRTDEGRLLTAQAQATAEKLGDPRILGHVLTHKACEEFYSMQFGATVALAGEAIKLIAAAAPWDRVEALAVAQYALFGMGRLDECKRRWGPLAELAQRIGHLGCLWMGQRIHGLCEVVQQGTVTRLAEFAEQDRLLSEQGSIRWVSESYGWLGFAKLFQGEWEAAGDYFRTSAGLEPADFTKGTDSSGLILWKAYSGQSTDVRTECRTALDRWRSAPRHTVGGWTELLHLVETAALIGETSLAGAFYPQVLEVQRMGNVIRFTGIGLTATVAGIAAACAGQQEEAEAHFREAIRLADQLPHRFDQVETRRWYWWILNTRFPRQSRTDSAQLLRDAFHFARRTGMTSHLERFVALHST